MIRYKNSIETYNPDAIFVSIKLIFYLYSFFDKIILFLR
mgnify:FL=1